MRRHDEVRQLVERPCATAVIGGAILECGIQYHDAADQSLRPRAMAFPRAAEPRHDAALRHLEPRASSSGAGASSPANLDRFARGRRLKNVVIGGGARAPRRGTMIDLELYLAFVAATTISHLIPGPNVALNRRQQRRLRHPLRPPHGCRDELGDRVQLALTALGHDDRSGRARRLVRMESADRRRHIWLTSASSSSSRQAGRPDPGQAAAENPSARSMRVGSWSPPDQPQDVALLRRLPAAIRHSEPAHRGADRAAFGDLLHPCRPA